MMRQQQGWTLIEVMVSTSILVLLMVMMAEALSTTQRSWLTSRTTAAAQQELDYAAGVISRQLQQATLQTRPGYDGALNQTVPESDLHFVCGPSAELLPALPGACGDAVFFQRPMQDGSLTQVLQCSGFFVQYGGDEAWRPTFSSAIPVQRRFRLLQFHQPASGLTLFQPSGVAGGPPLQAQMTSRTDLYGWFSQPLGNSASYPGCVSVVAENVVAMFAQNTPTSLRCYDTRRQQWEPGSTDAISSRHQLPGMVEVTLVMTDESGWARLSVERAVALAEQLQNFVKGQSWLPSAMPQSLDAVKQMLMSNGMSVRIVVLNVAMGGQ